MLTLNRSSPLSERPSIHPGFTSVLSLSFSAFTISAVVFLLFPGFRIRFHLFFLTVTLEDEKQKILPKTCMQQPYELHNVSEAYRELIQMQVVSFFLLVIVLCILYNIY